MSSIKVVELDKEGCFPTAPKTVLILPWSQQIRLLCNSPHIYRHTPCLLHSLQGHSQFA
jgi:glycogen debranching enzyme